VHNSLEPAGPISPRSTRLQCVRAVQARHSVATNVTQLRILNAERLSQRVEGAADVAARGLHIGDDISPVLVSETADIALQTIHSAILAR
jgi:hypothetical protein